MNQEILIPEEIISHKIYLIRDQKVMIDSDLAELYQVETKRLNEQVRRNENRFPTDFMFQLTHEEWKNLKSQIATSSWGGRRTLPFVFSEHGVLMLSSVLKSERAATVNICIMRVYTQLRKLIVSNQELLAKLEELENKVHGQDEKIESVFNYLRRFIREEESPRKSLGY
jgi:cell division septum initiation protein DivIVA